MTMWILRELRSSILGKYQPFTLSIILHFDLMVSTLESRLSFKLTLHPFLLANL